MNPETRNLIDGRLVDSQSGKTFPNVNPATEQVIGATADATAADMDRAVGAARRAFDETRWSTDAAFRARCLRQLHAALAKAKDELREVVVAEAGSPIILGYSVQCDTTIDWFPFWADVAERFAYESPMPDMEFMGMASRRLLRREAAGVVGAITPWNFPLYLNLTKIGPALAAGCTVVLKPAPDTPWCATMLGRLVAEETDIPPGVLNVVAGADHALGEMLATDPRVDVVTFTGSTATGRRVMEKAAGTVKRVLLELGGKSATIMLDDADLSSTLAGIGQVCTHGGQGCALTTRLLLPRSRYEEGVALAKAAFEGFPYGDPNDPSHLQGPQVSARQRERVLGYVAKAKQEGARLVTGGGTPKHLPQGYYVEPTLFADVRNDSTLAREEVFGPVLAVIPFEDDDDADLSSTLASIGQVCTHGGQGCALTTRLLLPRSRYEEGVALAKAAFEGFPYGDPNDPSHLQGPQVSARQRERVLGYVAKAKQEGARLVTGGGTPKHLPKGYYVEPTLFADVRNDSTLAREEVFGPVLAVIPFEDDDDAVRIANDSIYGLSGAVASASEERALAVARRIRTGTLAVNGAMWFAVDTPFGGYRQSGLGRENGVQGFEEYLETKVIALPARG